MQRVVPHAHLPWIWGAPVSHLASSSARNASTSFGIGGFHLGSVSNSDAEVPVPRPTLTRRNGRGGLLSIPTSARPRYTQAHPGPLSDECTSSPYSRTTARVDRSRPKQHARRTLLVALCYRPWAVAQQPAIHWPSGYPWTTTAHMLMNDHPLLGRSDAPSSS
ncbi:hypothetical protein L227DRAFT_42686 [Lentinus tigrinus ALCF2SS1-6]|uniref:Uncharacterized protein n=1 Tax=Lentinus tigrinus ALCF2SS1-6 TaxID=1328759 RepID=A0A5C2SDK5_9APHY|nr:hypothetical protein L227DRAFT_42686 [Lentinus tigrinus ALCF2SS1-6]